MRRRFDPDDLLGVDGRRVDAGVDGPRPADALHAVAHPARDHDVVAGPQLLRPRPHRDPDRAFDHVHPVHAVGVDVHREDARELDQQARHALRLLHHPDPERPEIRGGRLGHNLGALEEEALGQNLAGSSRRRRGLAWGASGAGANHESQDRGW